MSSCVLIIEWKVQNLLLSFLLSYFILLSFIYFSLWEGSAPVHSWALPLRHFKVLCIPVYAANPQPLLFSSSISLSRFTSLLSSPFNFSGYLLLV